MKKLLMLGVIAGFVFSACTKTSPPAMINDPAASAGAFQSPPSVTTNTITIQNFTFSPEAMTVSPGATITVTNLDTAQHNVSSTNGNFKTAFLNQNESATFTVPTTVGTYDYICDLHPIMKGQLVVK